MATVYLFSLSIIVFSVSFVVTQTPGISNSTFDKQQETNIEIVNDNEENIDTNNNWANGMDTGSDNEGRGGGWDSTITTTANGMDTGSDKDGRGGGWDSTITTTAYGMDTGRDKDERGGGWDSTTTITTPTHVMGTGIDKEGSGGGSNSTTTTDSMLVAHDINKTSARKDESTWYLDPSATDYSPPGPCNSNPCHHGGHCRQHPLTPQLDFKCACPLGRMGKLCDENMAECHSMPCTSVSDCVSTPMGAMCICDSGDLGQFCSISMANITEWDMIRQVVTQRTVLTMEVEAGVVLGLILLFCVCLTIHFCRVAAKRHKCREKYKEVVSRGEIPTALPPDWLDVHNNLLCCWRYKLPTSYTKLGETESEEVNDKKRKHKKSKKEKKKKKKKKRHKNDASVDETSHRSSKKKKKSKRKDKNQSSKSIEGNTMLTDNEFIDSDTNQISRSLGLSSSESSGSSDTESGGKSRSCKKDFSDSSFDRSPESAYNKRTRLRRHNVGSHDVSECDLNEMQNLRVNHRSRSQGTRCQFRGRGSTENDAVHLSKSQNRAYNQRSRSSENDFRRNLVLSGQDVDDSSFDQRPRTQDNANSQRSRSRETCVDRRSRLRDRDVNERGLEQKSMSRYQDACQRPSRSRDNVVGQSLGLNSRDRDYSPLRRDLDLDYYRHNYNLHTCNVRDCGVTYLR